MRKISEILRQRHGLKRSYRDIGNSLNISISTIAEYLSRAKAAGLSWPLPTLSEEELYAKLFLPTEKTTPKKTAPNWEWAHQELRKKGVTLLLLWREYREIHADGYGYTNFCNKYRDYAKQLSPVMRQTHTAMCNFLQALLLPMPCLRIFHSPSPKIFIPELSTTKCNGVSVLFLYAGNVSEA